MDVSSAHLDTGALVWVMGTAAAMTVAAVNAFGWLVSLLMAVERRQVEARHRQASEFAGKLLELEHSLERRIERLEEHSLGFRAMRDRLAPGSDGD